MKRIKQLLQKTQIRSLYRKTSEECSYTVAVNSSEVKMETQTEHSVKAASIILTKVIPFIKRPGKLFVVITVINTQGHRKILHRETDTATKYYVCPFR